MRFFGDTEKTPISQSLMVIFFIIKEIGDSGNDDARNKSQAAWMHGMRKSLSSIRREPSRRHRRHGRGEVVMLQNPSAEQGPNVHL